MSSKVISFLDWIRRFWNETYSEVAKKAIWPTWKELWQYTFVVCVAVIVLTIVIGMFDFSLTNLVQYLTQLVK